MYILIVLPHPPTDEKKSLKEHYQSRTPQGIIRKIKEVQEENTRNVSMVVFNIKTEVVEQGMIAALFNEKMISAVCVVRPNENKREIHTNPWKVFFFEDKLREVSRSLGGVGTESDINNDDLLVRLPWG
jgi:hypothetical protein